MSHFSNNIYRRESMHQLYSHLEAAADIDPYQWLAEHSDESGVDVSRIIPREKTPILTRPTSTTPSYHQQSSSASTSSSPNTPYHDNSDSEADSDDDDSDSDNDEPVDCPPDVWSVQGDYCTRVETPAPVVQDVPEVIVPVYASPAHSDHARLPSPIPVSAPAPLPARARAIPSYAVFDAADDSEADAEGSSDGDATDDEYKPDPEHSPNPLKRSRSSSSSRSASPDLVYYQRPQKPVSSRPAKRQRAAPSSRNIQVAVTPVASTLAFSTASVRRNEFICPTCGWEQKNKRVPDFKRHIKTHTRPTDDEPDKGWWCKGVPLADADHYTLPRDSKAYIFLGQTRIGGCRRTFSRRDALKRHLDNHNVDCVGRPVAATEE